MKKVKNKYGLISIVIPACNEEKNLAQTLTSLNNQTYKGPIEIIVVDNNSTDQTPSIAHKYGAHVITEPRKGVTFARQTGFFHAHGEIILSTDADTRVPPNWVEVYAEEFHKKLDAVLINGIYQFYDGGYSIKLLQYIFLPLFRIGSWYSAANMAVRKDSFLLVGGFNLSVQVAEDRDLAIRMRKIGKVYHLPHFAVYTSGRRFQKLGIIGGLWSYFSTYFRMKVHQGQHATFKSGSEIKHLNIFFKIGINVITLLFLLTGLLGVEHVKAEVKEDVHIPKKVIIKERQIKTNLSRIPVFHKHTTHTHISQQIPTP